MGGMHISAPHDTHKPVTKERGIKVRDLMRFTVIQCGLNQPVGLHCIAEKSFLRWNG